MLVDRQVAEDFTVSTLLPLRRSDLRDSGKLLALDALIDEVHRVLDGRLMDELQ